MRLGCGIPRSGATCNHCAGIRQEIKWGGNYRNWGVVQYSESLDMIESWCCCSLLGLSRWQIPRRQPKSGINRSCGRELPRVPHDLQVQRMIMVRDEQKQFHNQLCLQDNKSASVLWRFIKLCLELCLMPVLSHSLIPLKISNACTDRLGHYPALQYWGGRSVCAAFHLVYYKGTN